MKTSTLAFAVAALLSPFFVTTTLAQPPVILAQPTNEAVLAGETAVISVSASGSGPLAYQWQFNGTNLPNIISTVAGGGTNYPGNGGPATNTAFNQPQSGVVDLLGNLYISDTVNNRVCKVDTNGIITTVAGTGTQGFAGDGGAATDAEVNNPNELAVDAFGDLWIADSKNNRVREVGANGIITTVAGNGTAGYLGDGGLATNASLNDPSGVAVDLAGNFYIVDNANNRIRKVDANGVITTIAGNGSYRYSGDGGPATNAGMEPFSVVVDASGNLFIADTGDNRIRKVDISGVITTVAGNGAQGYSGEGGAATNAELDFAFGLAVDGFGNIFIADSNNNRVCKVGANGIINPLAGNRVPGFFGDGGAATNAVLNLPFSVAVDASGNVFITDQNNGRIRKIAAFGPTLTLENTSSNDAGTYDLVVWSPSGSVTSSVATLTVVVPPAIAMSPPLLVSGANLALGFNLTQGSASSFTLLQFPAVTGPWTTNTAAVLTTNAILGGYQFSLPAPSSTEFYQVRSP